MKKWYDEEYEFTVEVTGFLRGDHTEKKTPEGSRITARTFGEFDLFVDGQPVSFPRSKAKELLAYLIDRQGGGISRATAAAVLWEDSLYDQSMQKQLDVIIRSLRSTLESVGAQDIFEMQAYFSNNSIEDMRARVCQSQVRFGEEIAAFMRYVEMRDSESDAAIERAVAEELELVEEGDILF